jgi:hypothetical protein
MQWSTRGQLMGASYVIVIGDQSQKPQAGAGAQEVRSEGFDKVQCCARAGMASLHDTRRTRRGSDAARGERQPTASSESHQHD